MTACATDADCAGATCANGWCPPAPFPSGPLVICGHIPDDSIQSYYRCGLDGPLPIQQEQPTITWYTTGGPLSGLSRPKGGTGNDLGSRTFTEFTRPAMPFTLWGVVRDGRDGEAWVVQDFP